MFTSKVECSFDLSRFTNSSLFSIAPGDASPLKETYDGDDAFWVAIRYADADGGVQVDLLDFDMDGIGMGGFESSVK